MVKRPGEKLGMSIKGGMKNFTGDESTDAGIFISRVSYRPIPSQGPRHTKDLINMVPVVPLFSTQH